jgi:hypothetical protein
MNQQESPGDRAVSVLSAGRTMKEHNLFHGSSGANSGDCPCFGNILSYSRPPPFPGSHLNMFLVKKENPPFFIPDPALPGRTYRPRASPVRVLLRRRVSDRYVLPQLASCGEMAIA